MAVIIEPVKNIEPEVEEPKTVEPTHRYFCDACTGTAFFHIEGEVLPRYATCKSCGKGVGPIKESNLIKI